MAESLKQVIEKLKAQQQNPRPAEPVKPIPAKFEEDDDDLLADEDEVTETPKASAKEEPKKEEIDVQQQILMEIEMLQNNGRFRAELLHQLQELNKALVVIANILVSREK